MYWRAGATPPLMPMLFQNSVLYSNSSYSGTPTAPIMPPARMMPAQVSMDWSVPTHSRAASTPAPSVRRRTASMASSPRSSTMSVAPNSLATACRSACRLSAMMRAAPSLLGGQDRRQADGAVADDGDGVALLDTGADRRVVAGAHDVRQRGEGGELLVGEPAVGRRDLDEGGVGVGGADLLALAAVVLAVAEGAAVDAVGLEPGAAGGAGAVVEGERGDDEVADREVRHVVADGLDDADVLVADAADLVRR